MALFDQHIPGVAAAPGPRGHSASVGGAYDAVVAKGRRQPPVARTRSEDDELLPVQRRMLGTGAADLQRNFAIAAWAIRKHLDYVSTFRFAARTGDDGLDDAVEAIVREWSRPENCDASRRFSLGGLVRMAECLRTTGGDCGVLQREDGRLQLVEGDRITTPFDMPVGTLPAGRTPQDLIHGVLVGPSGEPLAYAVSTRQRVTGGLKFERLVPAEWMYLHGYYTRYDQVRGVSPLSAAVNTFRDVYEGFDYALAKAKVQQLFALVITRKAADDLGVSVEAGDGEVPERTKYKIDPNRSPMMVDLDPGDDLRFENDATPSDQFQSFTAAMIQVGLKSLDIPLSFYDESHSSWNGSRQALLQYEMGANIKRAGNRELLDRQVRWRLGLALRDRELVLPAKRTFDSLRWQWTAQNVRWTDPLKEVSANVAAVNARLKSPQQVIQDEGDDPYEVVDQIAEWEAYLAEKNVAAVGGGTAPEVPPDAPEVQNAGGGRPRR